MRQRAREKRSVNIVLRYEIADLSSNCPISNEGDRVERTTTIKHSKKRVKKVDNKICCSVCGSRLKDILEC